MVIRAVCHQFGTGFKTEAMPLYLLICLSSHTFSTQNNNFLGILDGNSGGTAQQIANDRSVEATRCKE